MADDTESVVPSWACAPKLENCGLLVKKGDTVIEKLATIQEKKCVIFGRNQSLCDIKLDHPSISRQHAIIAHGSSGNVYLMDLGSSHGTFKNGKRLEPNKREALADLDIIKFGASTREYIVRLDLDVPMAITEHNTDHDHHEKLTSDTNAKERRTSGHKRSWAESHNTDVNTSNEHNDRNKTNDDLSKKPKKELVQVRCSHLLIKHKDSRKPQSWKNETIDITKAEALEKAEKIRQEILAQVSSNNSQDNNVRKVFKEFAMRESDCNSYRRGGDLGLFGLGKMQKPFEEAAFNLQIGELSQPVETASGVHLILRTE